MAGRTITIPYGRDTLSFRVPADRLEGVFSPRSMAPLEPVSAALNACLDAPRGCPGLHDSLRERKPRGVVIAIDDLTRNTPVYAVLPRLLDYCNESGVPDDRIRVVIALGTHRPMTDEEIRHKAGREAFSRVRFINPRYDSPEDLVHYGTSATGVDVWINKTYAEADFKIAIGSVIPHGAVGFSGGAKIVYPGVAGRQTVEAFHRAANLNPANRSGVLGTPIRREIEEMVEMVGLDFLIQIVSDGSGRIVGLAAGHYVEAHREAVRLARAVYEISLRRQVRAAVVGSHPADIDFWQAAKCISNCESVVEDDGWLILVTPCPEGIPAEHVLFDEYIGTDPDKLLESLRTGAVEDAVTASPAWSIARLCGRIHVGIVSDGLSPEQVRRMQFHPFASVEDALTRAFAQHRGGKAAVFTHGGETFAFTGLEAEEP